MTATHKATEIASEVADAFAVKTEFDPRRLSNPYLYFTIRPRRLRAWREADELDGAELLRGGEWQVE